VNQAVAFPTFDNETFTSGEITRAPAAFVAVQKACGNSYHIEMTQLYMNSNIFEHMDRGYSGVSYIERLKQAIDSGVFYSGLDPTSPIGRIMLADGPRAGIYGNGGPDYLLSG